jgi:hypothetical protein
MFKKGDIPWNRKELKVKLIDGVKKITKVCSRCEQEKEISKFYKAKRNKDKLSCYCKICQNKINKQYRINNIEKVLKKQKQWYNNNKEETQKYRKQWYNNNKERVNKTARRRRNSKANYNTYARYISFADAVKNIDGFLQTKCTYCGKWYFPLIKSIQSRSFALNKRIGNGSTENRLYCSEECKQACPIYKKILYQVGHPKNFEDTSSREVQPELRQMVFKRDNYICQKCNKFQGDLDVPLHCHHIEGVRWEPLESADIDKCMTVCQHCHIKIHKQEDCRYVDMQCKELK